MAAAIDSASQSQGLILFFLAANKKQIGSRQTQSHNPTVRYIDIHTHFDTARPICRVPKLFFCAVAAQHNNTATSAFVCVPQQRISPCELSKWSAAMSYAENRTSESSTVASATTTTTNDDHDNDERRATSDERRTTNDERRTTNDERQKQKKRQQDMARHRRRGFLDCRVVLWRVFEHP